MFAIFLSNKMDPFYEIIVSFPTVIFTALVIFSILYWLLAVLGVVDFDAVSIDPPNIGGDAIGHGDSLSTLNVMAGLMIKLGLNGVPIAIVISSIALLGWLFSFIIVFFVFPYVPTSILKFVVGIGVLCGVTYVASMITAWLIKPLRTVFLASNQEVQKNILGKCAVVRTGAVDKKFGEALLEDGGAGLIVKVRSYKDEVFNRGDRVVLVEYVASENIYRVISEADFTT
jgi:hypothetical protein